MIKTGLLTTATATLIACSPPPQELKQKVEVATVLSFRHSQNTPSWVLQARIAGQVNSICNFAKVTIERIDYVATAKHCLPIVGDDLRGHDIVTIKNLSQFYANRWVSAVTFNSVFKYVPPAVPLSAENHLSIAGKTIRAMGCFSESGPEMDNVYCYMIEGKAYPMDNGMVGIFMSVKDQERILSKDLSKRATRIVGMSGSPVFDEQGAYFGTLSINLNRGKTIYGNNLIGVTPIRNEDGKIVARSIQE
jgi:hypothetical protein